MLHFSCSLTRNITSHSMENLGFHSLIRCQMIILSILTTPLIHFFFWRFGRMYFLISGLKGLMPLNLFSSWWTVATVTYEPCQTPDTPYPGTSARSQCSAKNTNLWFVNHCTRLQLWCSSQRAKNLHGPKTGRQSADDQTCLLNVRCWCSVGTLKL